MFSTLFPVYSLCFLLYFLCIPCVFYFIPCVFYFISCVFTVFSTLFPVFSTVFPVYSLCFLLYSLCFLLYSLCFLLYSLCFLLYYCITVLLLVQLRAFRSSITEFTCTLTIHFIHPSVFLLCFKLLYFLCVSLDFSWKCNKEDKLKWNVIIACNVQFA